MSLVIKLQRRTSRFLTFAREEKRDPISTFLLLFSPLGTKDGREKTGVVLLSLFQAFEIEVVALDAPETLRLQGSGAR